MGPTGPPVRAGTAQGEVPATLRAPVRWGKGQAEAAAVEEDDPEPEESLLELDDVDPPSEEPDDPDELSEEPVSVLDVDEELDDELELDDERLSFL